MTTGAKSIKITDFATPEELAPFTERSNARAIGALVFNWVAVAAIFAGVAQWTNPLTILAGIALLGGRQLGFAALMHDCGHRTLFANATANDLIGQWLCAYPVLSDLPRYAAGHRKHHAFAGTRNDPDLPNYQRYPISKTSFRRKIVRDLTGQTGWKALRATWRRGKTELKHAPWNGNALAGHAIVNGAMFGVLYSAGEGWLFLMCDRTLAASSRTRCRARSVRSRSAHEHPHDPSSLVGETLPCTLQPELSPRAPLPLGNPPLSPGGVSLLPGVEGHVRGNGVSRRIQGTLREGGSRPDSGRRDARLVTIGH
ncbi:MAG: fatty acid desaturase [Deltaproteobacteria bacterium]|nr:fatty acid desaturase [Deltaproteobacteria bacterium]